MKITVKELNNGYKYVSNDNMNCLYKESNVYFVLGFERSFGHIYRTFDKLVDAKKLYLSLIK